jgi:uncharacterized damage-inducible protein DinB
MPGQVPPVADEREGLLAFLAQQRQALRAACVGLDEPQARATPSVSALSVGGLVKHLAQVERRWVRMVQRPGEPSGDLEAAAEDYSDGFRLGPQETLAGALAAYDAVAAETERVVAGIDDLGQAVPVPKGVPWFPDDVEAWSVRWVLLHLIEETARHAGHADIVREFLDGATCYELLAALEGWPATDWVRPWQPRAMSAN